VTEDLETVVEAVDRLQGAIERLRRDRDAWRIVAEGHEIRLRKAEAEVERLREALSRA
jgi:hypothetical protein